MVRKAKHRPRSTRSLAFESLDQRNLFATVYLDGSFGTGAKVTTHVGSNAGADFAYAVQKQSDGKIVVGGTSDGQFAVVRYLANGQLDTTFSGDGILLHQFPGHSYSEARAVYVQKDGKILAAGVSNGDLCVARYNSNGTLDTTFSSDGMLIVSQFYLVARAIAVQSDGKIVIGGTDGSDFFVLRLLPNGTPDTAFSGDGQTTIDFGRDDVAVGLRIESGNILVLGPTGSFDDNGHASADTHLAAARLLPNGDLDTSYETAGRYISTSVFPTVPNFVGEAIAATGTNVNNLTIFGVGTYTNSFGPQFGIVKGSTSGSIDTSFHNGGVAPVLLGSSGYSAAYAATVESDGHLLVVGTAASDKGLDFALTRVGAVPTITSVTIPSKAIEKHDVALSASAYVAVESNPASSYSWFISGPAGFNANSSAADFAFQPPTAGPYTVRLTVKDAVGVSVSQTKTVNVIADAPQVTRFVVPETAIEGGVLSFGARAVEPLTTTEAASYHWTLTGPFYTATFETRDVRIKAIDDGPFTATLVVTGANGATTTMSSEIAIANVPPAITLFSVPATARIFHTARLTANATDVAGIRDTIKFAWTITGPGGYKKTFGIQSPQWKPPVRPGTYSVKLTVYDEDFGVTTAVKQVKLGF